jgi:hypothetical protein
MLFMKPKFKNTLAWEQAELLMQPAFIRVIDNIRKQLEDSSWQGSYQEVVDPYPGYQLCLTRQDRLVQVDIWDLCFQICFSNYHPTQSETYGEKITETQEVEIDINLIDETGDVDWQRLETKTQRIVKRMFADLPVISQTIGVKHDSGTTSDSA